MTEQDYIAALEESWPEAPPASREILSLACLAVRDFPQSAKLWWLRGQLIRMAPADYIFSRLDAEASFAEAIRLDPTLADRSGRSGTPEEDERSEPNPPGHPGKNRKANR